MPTSIHDNDPSSNCKSKAKHERKSIINEKQWRSDEIMQLICMLEQKNFIMQLLLIIQSAFVNLGFII